MNRKKKICMVVQDPMVKGGIAAVVNGYRGSILEKIFSIKYVESYKDGSKFTKLLKAIFGYLHFLMVLLLEKPNIVHIHSSFGPSFYRKIPYIYLAYWAGIPIINHCHGADFDTFFLNASEKKKRLIRKIYNKCNIMIALSEEWKERLSMIVPSERIVIIENYSTIHKDAVHDKLNRKSNGQILFLGEIGLRKGCYDIPEVVKKVVEEIPTVKFVLGGSGDIDNIRDLLIEKGVEKYVIFPGWVRDEEKDKLLRKSDVFFLPSYNEGMPMSILDAMGYGLPVVSTRVGGIPKIVHEDENGYVCEPGDVDGFAEALVKLLTEADKLKRFSKNSYSIVSKDYSFESNISKIEHLYKSI
ncbi:glycosyltransferase family 4 protein [Bacillus sp. OTU2372]|uniref:glycosyltransferase family 4 protein n=1 Tax=Bacillus sp. OTU2372 TaxID=3043858 RepID=UPI00313EC1E1